MSTKLGFFHWSRSRLRKCSSFLVKQEPGVSKICEETELVFLVYQSKLKQNAISQLGAHSQLAFAQLTVRCTPSANSTVQILTLLGSGSKFKDTKEKDRACYLSTSILYQSFIHTQKTQNIYFVHLLSAFQKGEGERHRTVTADPEFGSQVQSLILSLLSMAATNHMTVLCHTATSSLQRHR